MTNQEYQAALKELWDCAYHTFEQRPGSGIRTTLAINAQSNDVQFRLSSNIQKLQKDKDASIINEVEADVMLARTVGWMTRETSDKMLGIIGKIREA